MIKRNCKFLLIKAKFKVYIKALLNLNLIKNIMKLSKSF